METDESKTETEERGASELTRLLGSTIIECDDMNEAVEKLESLSGKWDHFTIGNGTAEYHFWTPSPTGFYYVYRCMENGNAGCERQVELDKPIKIHLKQKYT